jgi:hypothetical protein
MNAKRTAGYSGTPLAQKLGIKAGARLCAIDPPPGYRALLAPLPDGVRFAPHPDTATDLAHLFVTDRAELKRQLSALRVSLHAEAVLWVSWPKRSARVATDVTEDTIRTLALPLGFVDVKVCAVNDLWSGLKLVVRKALRPAASARIPSAKRPGHAPKSR